MIVRKYAPAVSDLALPLKHAHEEKGSVSISNFGKLRKKYKKNSRCRNKTQVILSKAYEDLVVTTPLIVLFLKCW